MILPAYMLRHNSTVSSLSGIRRLVLRRLKLWNEGKYTECVNDIVNITKQGSGGGQQEEDDESIACTYHSMGIDGRLRAGVHWLMNRDDGGS